MSWFDNVVRLKLRELVGARETPEDLWHACPECERLIFRRDLERNLHVCHHCGHHMRLRVRERMAMLFDGGDFRTIELTRPPVDPLRFRDRRRYSDRLKEAQVRSGHPEAMVVAHGAMGGLAAVVAVLDDAFMDGSMGVAVGEALVAAARLAMVQDAALIVVAASGGIRVQEGALALAQMARATVAIEELRESGRPVIVVAVGAVPPGGVADALAMLSDIALSEPGAETIHNGGLPDAVLDRRALRDRLVQIVGVLRDPRPAADVLPLPVPAPIPAPDPGNLTAE